MRRKVALLLGCVLLLFVVSSQGATPAKSQKDGNATQITLISGSSVPVSIDHSNERTPLSGHSGKINLVSIFWAIQLLDSAEHEVANNPASEVNSYTHNVFYVLLTANAP